MPSSWQVRLAALLVGLGAVLGVAMVVLAVRLLDSDPGFLFAILPVVVTALACAGFFLASVSLHDGGPALDRSHRGAPADHRARLRAAGDRRWPLWRTDRWSGCSIAFQGLALGRPDDVAGGQDRPRRVGGQHASNLRRGAVSPGPACGRTSRCSRVRGRLTRRPFPGSPGSRSRARSRRGGRPGRSRCAGDPPVGGAAPRPGTALAASPGRCSSSSTCGHADRGRAGAADRGLARRGLAARAPDACAALRSAAQPLAQPKQALDPVTARHSRTCYNNLLSSPRRARVHVPHVHG